LTDDDEEAKRFDMLVLRAQLAILQAKPGFAGLKEKIQSIASALEEQRPSPRSRRRLVLIQSLPATSGGKT
jgi:type I restriction enzyme R subunit